MPDGDIYESAYDLTYAGQNIASIFHFVQIGSDGAGDPRESIRQMFFNEFVTPYLVGLVDQVISVGLRTRRLFPTQTQATTFGFSNSGTIFTGGLPPNQCGVLRTYGPLLGRRGIGRLLIAGIPEEDVVDGRLNIDQIAFRNTLAAALEQDQDDGTTSFLWHAAVLSRVDNVARKINNAGILTAIRNLRSRTRSA